MTDGSARRRFLARAAATAGFGLVVGTSTRAGSMPPLKSAETTPSRRTRLGTHGMVLFGGFEGLYTSHMPMFHAPHDVQAIFRVRASDPALDIILRRAVANSQTYWSIEPEQFDLDRAAPDATVPLDGWRADVFEGHFERGGSRRHEDVSFAIEQIPLFERLRLAPSVTDYQEFITLGEGHEHFLVKRIDQRPDVDLIGRFRTAQHVRTGAALRTSAASHTAVADNDLGAALARIGMKAVEGVTWIYAETQDLT